MQIDSSVEDILKVVGRFRILCVGRSGVGKSSLINCVFGVNEASVSHLEPGEASIDKGYTSKENPFFVLHDSQGFEPGDNGTFGVVSKFIEQRRNESLLKDQLHAVWLCTETPRAGGRIFEAGDENLLRLAYRTQTPVVIVFTKYDKLVRTRKEELREDYPGMDSKTLDGRSKAEAEGALNECVQSLRHTLDGMRTPMVPHVSVSDRPGYEAQMLSLVKVTRDLVREMLQNDASVMWAIAQRASLPVKIDVSVAIATRYHRIALAGGPPMGLRDCLAKVHQDIVTSWNFRDEENILSSKEFRRLMQYIVQGVQESQNQGQSHVTPPLAVDKISEFLSLMTTVPPVPSPIAVIGLTDPFATWFSTTVLDYSHPALRVLIAYTADLITVLKSLFDIVIISGFSGTTTWFALKDVFRASEQSDPYHQIHRRICADFQHDQQFRDPNSFRHFLPQLLEGGTPLSGSRPAETEHRSAPATREPVPSSSSTRVPMQRHERTVVPVPSRGRNGVHPPPLQAQSQPRPRTNAPVPPPQITALPTPPPQSAAVSTPPPQFTAKSPPLPRNDTKPPMWRRLLRFFSTRSQSA